MQLVEDRVLIRPEEERTESTFVVPKDALQRPVKGEVVQVGPGTYIKGLFVPMTVKVGDIVIYGKYAGNEVDVRGIEYMVLRQPDILVILEDEDLETTNEENK